MAGVTTGRGSGEGAAGGLGEAGRHPVERAAGDAAELRAVDRRLRGDVPGRAVDAAAGVGGRAGQVEPVDGHLGPPEPRERAEDELLVQLRRAAVDGAAD